MEESPMTQGVSANPAPVKSAAEIAAWFTAYRHRLSGGGLWMDGGEPGRMSAAEAPASDFRVLFARLSTWEDTVESFTHRLLYQIARSVPGVFADYAFLPGRADGALFDEAGIPWLTGIHSKIPASAFDLIGISNSIVQELANLAPMLEKSGIPLKKSERMARPDLPLVILGGANAIHTSLLMVPEPPVDLIFAGEDVALVREIVRIATEGKRRGLSKAEIVAELVKLDGCIAPEAARATKKHHAERPGSMDLMTDPPRPLAEDAAGSGTLQLSEGCRSFCSFCSESYVRKPYREEAVEGLVAAARAMKKAQGLSRIDLFSFNYASYGEFYALVDRLLAIYPQIGLKSQRMDTIAGDPRLLPLMHALGKTSLTFGIEGISPRLRRYLHKGLPETTLRRAMEIVMGAPVREVKLFFILTGLETAADFAALSDLAFFIKALGERVGRGPRLVFSATALVRFPWTPLEWEAAPSMKEVARLAEEFEKTVSRTGYEARMAAPAEEYWVSQVLVRARDPRVWEALVSAQKKTGFAYQRMVTHSFHTAFREALAATGLDPDTCAAPADFDDDTVPWAKLGSGLSRKFLRKKALEARDYTEAPAHPPVKAAEVVRGVYVPPHERAKARLDAWRKTAVTVPVGLRIAPSLAGVPRSVLAARLAAAVFAEWDDLVEPYAGYEGCLIGKDWAETPATGLERINLSFSFGAAEVFARRIVDPEGRARVNARLGDDLAVIARPPEEGEGLRYAFRSPFEFKGAAWCAAAHIKFTLRRPEKGLSVYDIAPQSKKKASVADLTCREAEGMWIVSFLARSGFDLKNFLSTAFALPSREDSLRIGVVVSREGDIE
jgi:radical SAM superfamily enzyme YgiQ (UPF0313 family)